MLFTRFYNVKTIMRPENHASPCEFQCELQKLKIDYAFSGENFRTRKNYPFPRILRRGSFLIIKSNSEENYPFSNFIFQKKKCEHTVNISSNM